MREPEPLSTKSKDGLKDEVTLMVSDDKKVKKDKKPPSADLAATGAAV